MPKVIYQARDIPNDWVRTYRCPITECVRHNNGFATLKAKKHHVKTKHAGTKKAKS